MKNKILLILAVFLFSLALVACGEKPVATSPQPSDSALQSIAPTQAVSSQQPADIDKQENEQVPEEDSGNVDASLEGEALLASLSNVRPNKLMMTATLISYGMTTQMATYYDGENSRTETDVPDIGKSVLIILPAEDVMYSYIEGEASGVKMTYADKSYAEDMGLMVDASMFDEITESLSEDIIAKVDKLNGEDVIYIETTESDEDMGESLVKMWYSAKYATPLKYEIYIGDQKMAEYVVTEISDKVSIDSALFQPPADVAFQEADMNAMMGNW